jgi:hypothetical protein
MQFLVVTSLKPGAFDKTGCKDPADPDLPTPPPSDAGGIDGPCRTPGS